ncbi:MAG: selenocysteine-specific translation elongation factor [Candidatus Acidiferrales bacterium]
MDPLKHVIVGTAGHIDHGKSSLVEALTGTHPDRLAEEKRRGITIDLGFAFLDLPGVKIGFVDVPGHERFVRNMLAGVGGFDLVVLVVAADESIKPQTREHFDICRLLGIERGIVALTKSDLVESDTLDLMRLEIEEFVRGSFLEGAPIVPLSAKKGTGLDEFKRALHVAANQAAARPVDAHARLPIDRAFALKGFGSVVTGTLISGAIRNEDDLELYPTGERVRVRGLHSGGAAIERAKAGQRTAANVTGVPLEKIERGMVLAAPGAFDATTRVDARITLLHSAKPLKNRARVHFHQGSAERIAEVVLLGGAKDLASGDSAFAQIRLDAPLLILPGDRFILRRLSPVITIGGGAALDVKPARHKGDGRSAVSLLETIQRGNRPEILDALLHSANREFSQRDLIARTGWTSAEVVKAAISLTATNRARVISENPWAVVSAACLAEFAAKLVKAVDQFHHANPLLPGIPKQELRAEAGKPSAVLLEFALKDLKNAGALGLTGDFVHRANRGVELSHEESAAKSALEKEFESAGFAVPSLEAARAKLTVPAAKSEKLAQMLFREKVLVRVSPDLVLHVKTLRHLRQLVAAYKTKHGDRLPIAAFKELTGVSRKYAVPLLEHLDRERVTRRVGDERVIL